MLYVDGCWTGKGICSMVAEFGLLLHRVRSALNSVAIISSCTVVRISKEYLCSFFATKFQKIWHSSSSFLEDDCCSNSNALSNLSSWIFCLFLVVFGVGRGCISSLDWTFSFVSWDTLSFELCAITSTSAELSSLPI